MPIGQLRLIFITTSLGQETRTHCFKWIDVINLVFILAYRSSPFPMFHTHRNVILTYFLKSMTFDWPQRRLPNAKIYPR